MYTVLYYTAIQNAQDAWLLLKTLVDVPCLSQPAYKQRSVPAIQKTFMHQARFHLERRYVVYVTTSGLCYGDTVNGLLTYKEAYRYYRMVT